MHVTVETRKNQNTAPFLQAYGTLIYARSYTLNKLAIIQDMRKADFEKKEFLHTLQHFSAKPTSAKPIRSQEENKLYKRVWQAQVQGH